MKPQILVTFLLLFFSATLQGQGGFDASNTRTRGDYHLGFRIAPRISTLGASLEVAKGFTPNFGMRMGFNYFSYGYSGEQSDIDLDLELKLLSFAVLADWHPFEGAFRLTGGILINGNKISMNASLDNSSPEDIGDGAYNLDSVSGELSFNTIAPYFGLGVDTTFGDHDHWGFTFDIGLMYQGTPDLEYIVRGPDQNNPAIKADLEKEERDVEEELNWFKWYPVVSTGIVYQF
jgi:hypothetical protein